MQQIYELFHRSFLLIMVYFPSRSFSPLKGKPLELLSHQLNRTMMSSTIQQNHVTSGQRLWHRMHVSVQAWERELLHLYIVPFQWIFISVNYKDACRYHTRDESPPSMPQRSITK